MSKAVKIIVLIVGVLIVGGLIIYFSESYLKKDSEAKIATQLQVPEGWKQIDKKEMSENSWHLKNQENPTYMKRNMDYGVMYSLNGIEHILTINTSKSNASADKISKIIKDCQVDNCPKNYSLLNTHGKEILSLKRYPTLSEWQFLPDGDDTIVTVVSLSEKEPLEIDTIIDKLALVKD